MNKKGFMFVETIITSTILIVALVAVYVSYSAFIVSEKRRLYYDDMSYVYKTMTMRDLMYEEEVEYYDTTEDKMYYNIDALKKWREHAGSSAYIIGDSQRMYNATLENGEYNYSRSEKLYNIMQRYHAEYLIYIPNVSIIRGNNQDIYDIVSKISSIGGLSKEKASKLSVFGKYISKLQIPCEYDPNLCLDKNGESFYNGVIISIINEFKSGNKLDEDFINYMQCMEKSGKTTMNCQEANYITWVYA